MNKSHSTRRLMLVVGIVSGLFFLFSTFIGALTKSHATSEHFAIVTFKDVVSIHEKMKLNEGDFVEVVGVAKRGVQIRLEDGEIVSVEKKDIKRI